MRKVTPNKYHDLSDQQLLESWYADHDAKWLGILLERYTLLLLGVCMKYLKNEDEARDAVQQVFLKSISELQKYKVEYFKSWVYMVAKNHCLMRLRDRQGKISAELTENLMSTPAEENDRESFMQQDRVLQLLNESLAELSTEQQQCVALFYLEKKSYQQISDKTGFSLLQVKSYIQNGKRNLKLAIEKKLKQPERR